MRHAPSQEEIEDPKYQKLLGTRVLTDAFLEILEWDDYYTLPETLTMDARRIVDLRDQVQWASFLGVDNIHLRKITLFERSLFYGIYLSSASVSTEYTMSVFLIFPLTIFFY